MSVPHWASPTSGASSSLAAHPWLMNFRAGDSNNFEPLAHGVI